MKDWKAKWHEIIFEADTKEGKLFDVILLWLIVGSVILVMLGSVESLNQRFGLLFNNLEWIISTLFSIEYLMRILVLKRPMKYVISFYGVIDLLSLVPKYLSIFIAGSHALIALRSLRLLRMFRILKLGTYVGESNKLMTALIASRTKISVFLFAILILCTILGTVMYLVEDNSSGFTSIPRSIYWAIVTMTTVGYGDIAPQTVVGQFIASIMMIMGYGIIAIPTGIVSSEIVKQQPGKASLNTQSCPNCGAEKHDTFAKFCYRCGERLEG
ncbi:ion transporter [Jiulongibacter sp. NS-SX5]|uniref:ion transporter n=1 Tax=Jiulongibacter sp. NS-SX5 TaxID=3463854 RepID=UPI004059DD59